MSGNKTWSHDATFCVAVEKREHSEPVFLQAMRHLENAGYTVTRDPRIERDYAVLGPSHRLISRRTPAGSLKCEAHFYPAGTKFECYQDVVFENPNGGRYDFQKVSKMPFLIRMQFKHLMTDFQSFYDSLGFERRSQIDASASPLEQFNASWNYRDSNGVSTRFRRDETGWPDASELKSWSQMSGDGIPLTQGVLAYAKHHSHRWICGRVYGGINGMWRMHDAKNKIIENHNASAFFINPPACLKGRQVDRKKYLTKLEAEAKKAFELKNWRRLSAISTALDRQR